MSYKLRLVAFVLVLPLLGPIFLTFAVLEWIFKGVSLSESLRYCLPDRPEVSQ